MAFLAALLGGGGAGAGAAGAAGSGAAAGGAAGAGAGTAGAAGAGAGGGGLLSSLLGTGAATAATGGGGVAAPVSQGALSAMSSPTAMPMTASAPLDLTQAGPGGGVANGFGQNMTPVPPSGSFMGSPGMMTSPGVSDTGGGFNFSSWLKKINDALSEFQQSPLGQMLGKAEDKQQEQMPPPPMIPMTFAPLPPVNPQPMSQDDAASWLRALNMQG